MKITDALKVLIDEAEGELADHSSVMTSQAIKKLKQAIEVTQDLLDLLKGDSK